MADLERLRQDYLRAIAANPHPVLLDKLPWRVRLRLRLTSCTDHVATWLVRHGHFRAAKILWRI